MRMLHLALLATLCFSAIASERNVSYVYKHGSQTYSQSGTDSWDAIGRIANRSDGDFIWYRNQRGAWLINDANVLAAAKKAYAEVDAMEPEIEALHARMRPVEQESEGLEKQIVKLSDDYDDEQLSEAEQAEHENSMRGLEEKQEAIERRLHPLEQEEERLDQKHDRLEQIAEEKLIRLIERAIAEGVAVRQ